MGKANKKSGKLWWLTPLILCLFFRHAFGSGTLCCFQYQV